MYGGNWEGRDGVLGGVCMFPFPPRNLAGILHQFGSLISFFKKKKT